MSERKNESDNARYREGYESGRQHGYTFQDAVGDLASGYDSVYKAGRRAGIEDRNRYGQRKDFAGGSAEARRTADDKPERRARAAQSAGGASSYYAYSGPSSGSAASGSLGFGPLPYLIAALALIVWLTFGSEAQPEWEELGRWGSGIHEVRLRAGEASPPFSGTRGGGGGPPACFLWTAEKGFGTVRLRYQLVRMYPSSSPRFEPGPEIEAQDLHHCVYYGQWFRYGIVLTSDVDQVVRVGWQSIGSKSRFRPGFNPPGTLAPGHALEARGR